MLLVPCVISVDQHRDKRFPRRRTEVIRSIKSNHPPLKDNDNLSGFDEQEKQTISRDTKINHPQLSVEFDPFLIMSMNDYESEIILPQKARSVNGKKKTVSNLKDIDNMKNTKRVPSSSDIDTAPKTHRRRSQIRRVKVSKNKLHEYVNKTESALNETESVVKEGVQRVKTQTVNQAHTRSNNQPSINRRKGLREAVVPIVESENYVFSHSGDFHYRYQSYPLFISYRQIKNPYSTKAMLSNVLQLRRRRRH